MDVLKRVLKLAGGALLCSMLAASVALAVASWTLPPSDLAFRSPFPFILLNPAVLIVWLMMIALGAAVGFGLALPILWRIDLRRAVPAVAIAAAAAAGVGITYGLFEALLLGLAAGAIAMVTLRFAAVRWTRLLAQQ